MPTERFHHLPQTKRERIGCAIITEFQETSFRKMRVSRIARNAKISRGSLYSYFTDKEDMLMFSMNVVWRQIVEKDRHMLEKAKGDVWEMLCEGLREQMEACDDNLLYRNFYLFRMPEEKMKGLPGPEEELTGAGCSRWIYENCTNGELLQLTREEFEGFLDLCSAFRRVSLQEYLVGVQSREQAVSRFKRRLLLMKMGIRRAICRQLRMEGEGR